jgi:cell division protease FtsH
MKNKPIAKEVDVKVLARRTSGFVGSDIENLVNEASLLAARKNKNEVGMEELEESIDRVIAGPEKKSRVMRDKEKRIIACHESGHTADPIHKVSIIPRGSAVLGYTLQLPLEDRYLATKSELMDKLSVLLAGRASEDLIFKEVSTGAQNDLKQATLIVRKMICDYGMSEKLGPVTLGSGDAEVFLGRDFLKEKNYSEELAFDIDKEIRRMIEECHSRALEILRENRDKLDTLARLLEEKEVLAKEEIEEILGQNIVGEKPAKLKKVVKRRLVHKSSHGDESRKRNDAPSKK